MNVEELRESIGKEIWLSEKTRVTKRTVARIWENSKMVVVDDADDKDWTQVQKYADFFQTKEDAVLETTKKIKTRLEEIATEKKILEKSLEELERT